MKANITTTLISRLTPRDKPYDVRDGNLIGFLIRVNISGKMLYMCEYARGKRITIGKVGVLTTVQARDMAKEILADAIKGIDHSAQRKQKNKSLTFSIYLEEHYKPWVEANRKTGKGTVARLKANFLKNLENKLLQEIEPLSIEQWRVQRLKNGVKAITLNRDIIGLKAAISKAVEWEFIDVHPLKKLKLSKVDAHPKVRYLSKDEETRLRNTVDKRETEVRAARERWRPAEQKQSSSKNCHLHVEPFIDYMKPMILISLNTGLRQGELFNLTWKDFNPDQSLLTIVGESSKSGKTRHIPLNSEASDVLKTWRKQTEGEGLIFPSKINNERLNNVKRAWGNILRKAQISEFRWHDMRHHFASRLVMVGVDLNTVRELLGHSDIKMTLRYAHLAPEHKANAVAKLVQER